MAKKQFHIQRSTLCRNAFAVSRYDATATAAGSKYWWVMDVTRTINPLELKWKTRNGEIVSEREFLAVKRAIKKMPQLPTEGKYISGEWVQIVDIK